MRKFIDTIYGSSQIASSIERKSLQILFCTLAVLFSLSSQISLASGRADNVRDSRDFAEALRLEALGHYDAAARIFREIQRKRPNDAYVLSALGNAYMNNYNDVANGVDKAEKCFLRALQLDPELGQAYARLAECYDSRGDFKTGVKMATKALSVKKPDYDGLRERAGAYSNLKRDKEALADIEEFLKRVQKVERKHLVQRATILENNKLYERALAEYRSLLKIKYEDQIVYREVACLQAMNKNDEAIKTLDGLVAHNKQDDAGYLNRARLYVKIGKYKEAVADFSKVLELQPSTIALKERAAAYEKMGRKDLAQKDLIEATRL